MISEDSWTMTNFGPVQIKSLLDRPHIYVSHEGAEDMYLGGYTFTAREHCLTIEAEGHTITVGMDQPIRLNGSSSMPARLLKKGAEIEVFPNLDPKWRGIGGTEEEGFMVGQVHQVDASTSLDELQSTLIDKGMNFLTEEGQAFIETLNNVESIEAKSFEFYKGYLRATVLDHMDFDGQFYLSDPKNCLSFPRVIRMLHRIGVHAKTRGPHHLVIPSYSLRQLILTVGFGAQGVDLFPQVENVTAPPSHTVTVTNIVPSIKEGAPKDLYSTRGSEEGTFTEVNGFLVVNS